MTAQALMKRVVLYLALVAAFTTEAFAFPVIDQAVPVGTTPIRVYPDHATRGVYWYIPLSIEPWTRDSRYTSSLYESSTALSFVFRGQASVDGNTLTKVARAIGTDPSNLLPIAYDYSRNFVCQNVFGEDPGLKWLFPKMIGNYLEVVPVSLRATNTDLAEEIKYHLTGGGLACTVEVGFKAVTTAYKLRLVADFNQVYSRFESAAHAEGWWWEVDLHTMLERLYREHVIRFESLEDASIPQTELDKKVNAAMEDVIKHITSAMFIPALKLPNEPMAGRGKAWSLRSDYRQTSESSHYEAVLQSQKVVIKDSQISLRMAVK